MSMCWCGPAFASPGISCTQMVNGAGGTVTAGGVEPGSAVGPQGRTAAPGSSRLRAWGRAFSGGRGVGGPGSGSLGGSQHEAVVVRRVTVGQGEFAELASGGQHAEDGTGVGAAGGDLRIQPGQAAQPDGCQGGGELIVHAMLAAGEVAQPRVVLGLLGERVVAGENKPAFAGGQQFAVVGGKAAGG